MKRNEKINLLLLSSVILTLAACKPEDAGGAIPNMPNQPVNPSKPTPSQPNKPTKPTVPSKPAKPVIPVSPAVTQTGIKQCSNIVGDSNTIDCATAVNYAKGTQAPKGQDGQYQAGKPLNYVVVHNKGTCIKDKSTGLFWEQKTFDGSLHDIENRYTWYVSDKGGNGGFVGTKDGRFCEGSACNTEDFVNAVNATNYCGFSDWRLPTRKELLSIVDYSTFNPTIDKKAFTKARPMLFWTASPYAGDKEYAWTVEFYAGHDNFYNKIKAYPVRLVRNGH